MTNNIKAGDKVVYVGDNLDWRGKVATAQEVQPSTIQNRVLIDIWHGDNSHWISDKLIQPLNQEGFEVGDEVMRITNCVHHARGFVFVIDHKDQNGILDARGYLHRPEHLHILKKAEKPTSDLFEIVEIPARKEKRLKDHVALDGLDNLLVVRGTDASNHGVWIEACSEDAFYTSADLTTLRDNLTEVRDYLREQEAG